AHSGRALALRWSSLGREPRRLGDWGCLDHADTCQDGVGPEEAGPSALTRRSAGLVSQVPPGASLDAIAEYCRSLDLMSTYQRADPGRLVGLLAPRPSVPASLFPLSADSDPSSTARPGGRGSVTADRG